MQISLFFLPIRKGTINFQGREVGLHPGRRNQARSLYFHKAPIQEVSPDALDDFRALDKVILALPFHIFPRFFLRGNFGDLAKSPKGRISVIPAKAGIQLFQTLKNYLDSGFHRSDDLFREHQFGRFFLF
jgi:hypothetical protein